MPLYEVQRKAAQSVADTTTLSAVLDASPTSGDRLVLCCESGATIPTPTGWVLDATRVDFVGLYIFSRVAQAGESSTVTIAPSSLAAASMLVIEYKYDGTFDVGAAGTAAGGGTTCASGTTAATKESDELAIAAFGWLNSTIITADTYTNSFVETHEAIGVATVAANNNSLAVATKVLTTPGAQTTTVTFSASNSSVKSGVIATYRTSPQNTSLPMRMPLGV